MQLAGILARRIVSWFCLGDSLGQGEAYGLIKFGSCTEVVLPLQVEIKVKAGDKLKGGISVIGVIDEVKQA